MTDSLERSAEGATVGTITAEVKRHLRGRMRALREALPDAAWAERNARVLAKLRSLPELERSRNVALFAAMPRRKEIDLRELHVELAARGSKLYYPFMDPTADGYRTGFRPVGSLDDLVARGRGFREPNPSVAPAERGTIDLVVVPALAVAPTGHRIGYGAGIYDATLPDVCPPALSVAIAFDFQLLVEVSTTVQDVACDIVVTESEILRRSG